MTPLAEQEQEMTMPKATLLSAAYTAALLSAAPVLAQSNTPPGDAGGGVINTPTHREAMPGSMAPGNPDANSTRAMHHASMGSRHTRQRQTASTGDGAVDRLNDESYRAAQRGQAFSGSDTSGRSGSGTMNDMPGGGMKTNGGKM